MKKFVFAVAILLLAAPAWAVEIWCANEANLVTVYYDATGDDPAIRAFALDIELDGDGEFADVQCLSAAYGYQIYPGDIDIDSQGNVDNWGSCKCDGGYPGTLDDSNSMTIEMGSLYEAGVDDDPCDTGELVSFIVLGHNLINVDLKLNLIRGGVVNEDAGAAETDITGCSLVLPSGECMPSDAPEYQNWVDVGKPKHWCCTYHKAPNGDMNGDGFVNINDVLLIRPPAFNVPYGDVNYDCRCDITHDKFVNINDLLPIRPPNFNVTLPEKCQDVQPDYCGDCGPNP